MLLLLGFLAALALGGGEAGLPVASTAAASSRSACADETLVVVAPGVAAVDAWGNIAPPPNISDTVLPLNCMS